MTIEEIKNYLKQIEGIDDLIASYSAELAEERAKSTSISSPIAGTSKSSTPGDRVGNAVTRIITAEERIQEQIDQKKALKAEIHKIIDNVPNNDEKLLLRLRYINGMTWEQIAEKMNYSRQWVLKKHKQALSRLL